MSVTLPIKRDVLLSAFAILSPANAKNRLPSVLLRPKPPFQFIFYDAGAVPSHWRDVSNYPFAANENMLIAAAYVYGLSAKMTAELYHDATLLSEEKLQARVQFGISAFQNREAQGNADIIASDYYAKHWRTSRLHFAKGHPLPETMRYFVGTLADKLEISDFDPVRTETIKGAFGYCMPVPRWVSSNLGLEFQMNTTRSAVGRLICRWKSSSRLSSSGTTCMVKMKSSVGLLTRSLTKWL